MIKNTDAETIESHPHEEQASRTETRTTPDLVGETQAGPRGSGFCPGKNTTEKLFGLKFDVPKNLQCHFHGASSSFQPHELISASRGRVSTKADSRRRAGAATLDPFKGLTVFRGLEMVPGKKRVDVSVALRVGLLLPLFSAHIPVWAAASCRVAALTFLSPHGPSSPTCSTGAAAQRRGLSV